MLQVVTPIKGSPAYKAGIQAGDIITTIIREVDSEGKPLDQAGGDLHQGPAADRRGQEDPRQARHQGQADRRARGRGQAAGVRDHRGRVEVETVLGFKRKTDDDWDYMIDPENKIGYIRLTSFARNTLPRPGPGHERT